MILVELFLRKSFIRICRRTVHIAPSEIIVFQANNTVSSHSDQRLRFDGREIVVAMTWETDFDEKNYNKTTWVALKATIPNVNRKTISSKSDSTFKKSSLLLLHIVYLYITGCAIFRYLNSWIFIRPIVKNTILKINK